MFGKHFELNETLLSFVEEIGRHMPGGFMIHKAEGDGEILYVNKSILNIFGCGSQEEFRELTGGMFRGMLVPEDYPAILDSVERQVAAGDDNEDYEEYRIIRKDGQIRWVDDFSHYTVTEAYGGIFYMFMSDITEKKERLETDMAVRSAVIEALSEAYHTVWLIRDVETGTFSLYRGDTEGATIHGTPIRAALDRMKYPDAKEYYIKTTVAPEDRERLEKELALERIAARLDEKPQFNINYLRLMDDGSKRYFRIEFARVSMPGGKVGVVCGFKDVDDDVRTGQRVQKALRDAKRAEEENRRLVEEAKTTARMVELTASMTSLLTNMPAMTFSKDSKTGVYVACNQAFAEYAHKPTPEGVVGLTDHEIFDRETADHFVADDAKALAMDGAYIFFEDVPDAVGNPRNFQTTKLKYTDAMGRQCLLGMCVDVTEMTRIKSAEAESRIRQQELEEKLALQDQLLEQKKMITALASDYWSVYYIELDHDHGICYQPHADVDDGLKEREEFSYMEAFTRYAEEYVTDEYREEFLRFIRPESIRKGLEAELVTSFQYMVRRKGREAYEMIRFAGVRHPEDRDDHIVHNVGACITDVDAQTRKTLDQNQALNVALTAAEEASRAKTVFLSNMSHEIRTPMNAIIGLNNIALNEPGVPDRVREHLEKIGISANHLLNIINDILDMSRIESGRMVIKEEEFCFSKTLEQVNTMISGQCHDKGLNYECRINGHIDDYYIGDDMKLRQVLINILGNAVKFTEEGTVTFTIEEAGRFKDKTMLRFIVHDTGIGMSPDYLPKIFDTFSQEDSSSTSVYGSTGLGMPITKNIVELMNGKIEVESEKGVGSTFTVTLMLDNSARSTTELHEYDILPHEMSVLVIDDDAIAREHAEIVLRQVGISCDTAESGAKGLDLVRVRHARREAYDLILVDWKMPEMDGLETTRRLREIIGHDSAIIILTSYNWDDIETEAREAGVDSFVPKPLFAATVMDEFREAFRIKNQSLFDETADLEGRRILLAEDMPVNAEIMVMILGMRDMEVDVAENGRIAVDLFLKEPAGTYDAILMDMRMPEMNGLDATMAIRASDHADAKDIPIIALTANAFDEDVERSMLAGLNAHLSKPVEPEALYETLENLIRK